MDYFLSKTDPFGLFLSTNDPFWTVFLVNWPAFDCFSKRLKMQLIITFNTSSPLKNKIFAIFGDIEAILGFDMIHKLLNKVEFDHFRWTSGIFAVSLCFLPLFNSIEIHDLKITGFERQSGVIFLLRKLKSQVQMAHLTLGFFWNLLNEIPIEIQWDHNSNSKYNWDHLKEKNSKY